LDLPLLRCISGPINRLIHGDLGTLFEGDSLMTNRKLIERLAHTLSVHHALLLAQGVLLQGLRVSKQEYAEAVKKCRPHAQIKDF
jgi:hypothetical protein